MYIDTKKGTHRKTFTARLEQAADTSILVSTRRDPRGHEEWVGTDCAKCNMYVCLTGVCVCVMTTMAF